MTVSGQGQVMLKITLTITLTLTYTWPPMFDRLQRRNNSHSAFINISFLNTFQLSTLCGKWQIKITVTSIKHYFPHPHYAAYCCAGHARRAVNCVISAVTWSDLWTNYHRSAVFIPHFTFRIPHSAVLHFTHSLYLMMSYINIRSGLCYFMPGQQMPGQCWDAGTSEALKISWQTSKRNRPKLCKFDQNNVYSLEIWSPKNITQTAEINRPKYSLMQYAQQA